MVLHPENHGFTHHLLILNLVLQECTFSTLNWLGIKLVIHSDYHVFTHHLISNLVFQKRLVIHSDYHFFLTTYLFWTCFLILNLDFQNNDIPSLIIMISPIASYFKLVFLILNLVFQKTYKIKLVVHSGYQGFTHHLLILNLFSLMLNLVLEKSLNTFKFLYFPLFSFIFLKHVRTDLLVLI